MTQRATFTDSEGRQWTLRVMMRTVRRIRQELDGFDVADLVESGNLHRLHRDPVLLADVLAVILADEIAARSDVETDAFCDAISGDVQTAAREALIEALADFSTQAERTRLTVTHNKLTELNQLLTDKAESLVEREAVLALFQAGVLTKDDPRVTAAGILAGDESATGTASNSPASVASSPGSSRSAS